MRVTGPLTLVCVSQAEYDQLLAECLANPKTTNVVGNAAALTITVDYDSGV